MKKNGNFGRYQNVIESKIASNRTGWKSGKGGYDYSRRFRRDGE